MSLPRAELDAAQGRPRDLRLLLQRLVKSSAAVPVLLALLTAITVLSQGYHFGVDDGAIYVPAAEKVYDPQLFPFGADFFLAHERLSIFATLVGDSARLLHLPVRTAIFGWHCAGIFLLLAAAWRLASACFAHMRARWTAVALFSALLPVPVAGTALPIMDPYLTARSLSTPLTLFAIAAFAEGKRRYALLGLVVTAFIHPQMSVYGFGFLLILWGWPRWWGAAAAEPSGAEPELEPVGVAALAAAPARLPGGFTLQPPSGTYREVLRTRTFFYSRQWTPWEWLGVFAPLAMLLAFARIRFRGVRPPFARLSAAAVPFGALATAAFLVLNASPALENFVRLQPMRAFHLIYVVMFLLLGGLLGEYLPGGSGALRILRTWAIPVLFLSLSAGMYALDRGDYPHSPHLELPGRASTGNPWTEAFAWIRTNTPKDAVFALDPEYLALPLEDHHGFRALAERSVLADRLKDSGAVSLFPQLAPEWAREQAAERGFKAFSVGDFERLASHYPVTWVVVARSQQAGLLCPYVNAALAVCRIPRPTSEATAFTGAASHST